MPSLESIAGFFTGAGVVLLLLFLYIRKGKKEKRFDERYEEVHSKARTISWSITLIVLMLLWVAAIVFDLGTLPFIFAISAYSVLLLSYIVSAIWLNKIM
ncbi:MULTISPECIES: hypothetical protein [Sporosarcina]|uniref:DUF2178 domain-containing protein n=1 Tax=Sporosarcina contaminans TaxID=633403 RepID=A0ABW3U135_9BACL